MVDDLDSLHIERCLVRVRGEQLLKHLKSATYRV